MSGRPAARTKGRGAIPALPVISTAAVASAAPGVVGLLSNLRPVASGMKVWGGAFTVRCRSGDNLALHRALAQARAGDVLVVELDGDTARGHWGELMTVAAQRIGLGGLVIDGTVRDAVAIVERGFPVFCRGTNPLPATKTDRGAIDVVISIQGQTIQPGDGVCADDDGVVIVPRAAIAATCRAVGDVVERERRVADRLARGETTLSALGLAGDEPHHSDEPERRDERS